MMSLRRIVLAGITRGEPRIQRAQPMTRDSPAARPVGRHLDRPASYLPGSETACDVCDRSKAHALGTLRRQSRTLAGGAEKHEPFIGGEDLLVVLALRVNPELKHAARTMKGARYAAFALELAN